MQLGRGFAQVGVACHIIHRPVPPGSQPVAQVFLRGRVDDGSGDTDRVKTRRGTQVAYSLFDLFRGVSLHFRECSFHLPDPAATDTLGAALATAVQPGLVITLEGDLGAGKTSLVRALLRAMGHTGPVKSPTYALVELYKFSSLCLYHFDFYRFNSPDEFLDAGFEEYFRDDAICCVEWPGNAEGALPAADIVIRFAIKSGVRDIFLQAQSARGEACLSRLDCPSLGPAEPTGN